MHHLLEAYWFCLPDLLPRCDWHHFGGHAGTSDPAMEAIAHISGIALGIIFMGSVFMFFVGGPIILAFTRRVRDLFWAIPAANVALYGATIILRPYPGGIGARFRMPGLTHTAIELAFLILASFGAATLLALMYLVYRLLKASVGWRNKGRQAASAPQAQQAFSKTGDSCDPLAGRPPR